MDCCEDVRYHRICLQAELSRECTVDSRIKSWRREHRDDVLIDHIKIRYKPFNCSGCGSDEACERTASEISVATMVYDNWETNWVFAIGVVGTIISGYAAHKLWQKCKLKDALYGPMVVVSAIAGLIGSLALLANTRLIEMVESRFHAYHGTERVDDTIRVRRQ